MLSNLQAMILVAILYLVFSSERGRQFFKYSRFLFFFGISVIIPCLCDIDSWPVVKP